MEFEIKKDLIFPTFVWECKVNNIDNDVIKDYCFNLKENTQGVTISNRGGWHSNELIFPFPPSLTTFFQGLDDLVKEFSIDLNIPTLKLGNIWFNINYQHNYNILHDHQKSILSGVYYVDVPDNNMGDLILHRGDNAEFFINSNNSFFSDLTYTVKPETSKFVIFPSWLKHHIERNESPKERISIAFNFVFL
jgi:uncharacterized protein (TIGR02466 family)